MCEAVGGEFFTLDESGYSSISTGKAVPAGLEDQVRLGVESCPEGALTIED
jgi:ferredoxin